MGPLSALAVGALTFATLASAGGSDNFNTWATTTAAPAPSPEKVTWSVWVTDYETQYSTVYITTTDYDTKYSTIYSTMTTTEIGAPVTVTSTTTEIGEPVTTTVTSTVGQPVSVPGPTVTSTITVTGPGSTGTVTVTAPGGTLTVTAPGQPSTIVQTITSVAVTTVVQSCTTSKPLTGLVTCSSRITNPTFTPTVTPPPNYLWGCRPGTVCKPKQEDCNFEQGDPGPNYFCSPDECIPAPGLAPQPDYNNAPINDTCAWYTPQENLFNLAPSLFGLDYYIFNTLNNTACTATATIVPPSALATAVISDTVTVTGVAQTLTKTITNVAAYTTQPPPVVVTTVESQAYTYTLSQQTVVETSVVDITYTSQPPPVYKTNTYTYTSVAVAPAETWQQWTSETVVVSAPAASSPGWNSWEGGKPQVTPRAVLNERAPTLAPKACYAKCNLANYAFVNDGKDSACDPSGQYALASSTAMECIMENDSALDTSIVDASIVTIFNVAKVYCSGRSTASPAPEQSGPASSSASPSSSTTPAASSTNSARPSSSVTPAQSSSTTTPASPPPQESSTTSAAPPPSSSAPSSPPSVNPDASQSSVLSSAIASVLSSTASQDASQSSVLSSAIASVFRPGSTSTVTVTGTASSAAPVGTFTGAAVPLVGGHEARLNSWLAMLVSLVAMMFGF